MPYITTRKNLKWFYKLKGEGVPLLFIHGWAGDLNIWQQQISFFSKNYQTIALDLPGHGKSSWEQSDLNQLAYDIEDIIKQINIKKVTIIALSLGGLIALKFALMFPENIERLVLVDTAAKFVSDSEKEGITLKQIESLSLLLERDYVLGLLFFSRSLFTEEEKKMPAFPSALGALIQRESPPKKEALQEFLKIIKNDDLREILPRITTPTLIVSGEKDYICAKPKAEELKSNLPNAFLKFIKNGGHVPFLTQPNIFNRILEDFLINGKVN